MVVFLIVLYVFWYCGYLYNLISKNQHLIGFCDDVCCLISTVHEMMLHVFEGHHGSNYQPQNYADVSRAHSLSNLPWAVVIVTGMELLCTLSNRDDNHLFRCYETQRRNALMKSATSTSCAMETPQGRQEPCLLPGAGNGAWMCLVVCSTQRQTWFAYYFRKFCKSPQHNFSYRLYSYWLLDFTAQIVSYFTLVRCYLW